MRAGNANMEVKAKLRTEGVDQRQCFTCHKAGHVSRACPNKRNVLQAQIKALQAKLDAEEKIEDLTAGKV